MEEIVLKSLPLGATGYISRCLSPLNAEVYRLLEMGLCRGARVTVMCRTPDNGAIEISLGESRLCIGNELAVQFMTVTQQVPSTL